MALDIVLDLKHEEYAPPPLGERDCFRRGRILFEEVLSLNWAGQGAPPAVDASEEIDYGHLDLFQWNEGTYRLQGDFGLMELYAGRVTVELAK